MNVEKATPNEIQQYIVHALDTRYYPRVGKNSYSIQKNRNKRLNNVLGRALSRVDQSTLKKVKNDIGKAIQRANSNSNINNWSNYYDKEWAQTGHNMTPLNKKMTEQISYISYNNYFGNTDWDKENLKEILTPIKWNHPPWENLQNTHARKKSLYLSSKHYKKPTNLKERLDEYKKTLQVAKIYNDNKFKKFAKNATTKDIENRVKFMDGFMGGILDFNDVRGFFVDKLYTTGNVNFKPSRELADNILSSNSVFFRDKLQYYNYALNKNKHISWPAYKKLQEHQKNTNIWLRHSPKLLDLSKVSFANLYNAKFNEHTLSNLIKAKLKTTPMNSSIFKNVMKSKMNNDTKLNVVKEYIKKRGITKTLNTLEKMNMIEINIYNPVSLNTGNHVLVNNLRFNNKGKLMINYALNKNTIKNLKNRKVNTNPRNRTSGFLKKLKSAKNISKSMAFYGANTRDPINRNKKLSPVSNKNNREWGAKTFRINGKLRSMGIHENKLKFFGHNSTKGISCTNVNHLQLAIIAQGLGIVPTPIRKSELCIALTIWAKTHKNQLVNREVGKTPMVNKFLRSRGAPTSEPKSKPKTLRQRLTKK